MSSTIHDMDFLDEYLVDSVTVDEHNIQAEYCRVSADLAYWGYRQAAAEKAYYLAKARVKQAEGTAYIQAREMLVAQEKKATEKTVEARALLAPALTEAQGELADAIQLRKEMVAIVEAVATKRDMLISLGATQRKEMDGDPSINDD